jgi:4-hydroxy-tetrahydrodipicolinate reductase
MGRALIQSTLQDRSLELVAAVVRGGDPAIGTDAAATVGGPACGIRITDDLSAAIAAADAVIDFTRPLATLTALAACTAAGKPLVIGTTGFSTEQKLAIQQVATRIPLCLAANYSIGVNVCLQLLENAAQALGDGYDVEIVEAHHRHKVDAPSGTALAMGEVVAAVLGRDLSQDAIYGRQGQTGARDARTIGFATVRGGDVVGDHTVMFLGDGERVEISHKASSRSNFARGALRAAAWLADGRSPGLYTMKQVLGL